MIAIVAAIALAADTPEVRVGSKAFTEGVILGDQPEWQAARAAVSQLMERYAQGASPRLRPQ